MISISAYCDAKQYPLVRKDVFRTNRKIRRALKGAKRKAACLELALYAHQGGEVAVGLDGCLIAALAQQQAEWWWPLINEMALRKVTLCTAVTMTERTWWVELPSIKSAIDAINHTNVQLSYEDLSRFSAPTG